MTGAIVFFEVEIRGVSNDRVGDSKVVSKYIKFIREITDIKEILNGATKIPSGAFANNLTLTDIEIPDSVESIYAFAFYDCKNLTHITIPSSIKTIGRGIFLQCEKLKDITYTGTMHQWRDIKDIDWKVIHCTIHCIDGDITYP